MKTYLEYLTESLTEMTDDYIDDPDSNPDEFYLRFDEAAQETERKKMEIHRSYYLRDNLQPLIDKAMTPKDVDKVIEFTGNFIDNNSKALMVAAPLYNFTFGEKEQDFFYRLIGLNRQDLKNMYDESVKLAYSGEHVEKQSVIVNMRTVPHMLIITGILIWAIQHNDKDLIEAIKYLVSFVWYPLIFRHYFSRGVNEAVMLYTIEHISSKRLIRQHKTMLSYLHYHGDVCYKNFEERLKDATDSIYADFNNRVRNQINSPMRGISNEYYPNYQKNATHHQTSDVYDDGNLSDQESTTSIIGNIADATFAKFTTTGVNTSIANTVAEGCDVSKAKLTSYLNKLLPLKENELFKMIENILIAFFASKPVDDNVGSGVFLNFGLGLYRSISSSKNPAKQTIGRILTKWTELLEIPKDYPTRPATVIGFRKAMFYYVIFMMQRFNS